MFRCKLTAQNWACKDLPSRRYAIAILFPLSETFPFRLKKILLEIIREIKNRWSLKCMCLHTLLSLPLSFCAHTVNNQDGFTVFLLYKPKLHWYISLGIVVVSLSL